ncbi:helix-turn-helix domain-containing protein [Halomonas sp. BC04]|uniref:helix-turn-helix domain-containing protein n=1 Tax=Halomonas sp. BC04 TaxID=1403540 RepID=UPI0009DE792D|nr:helix-turn-helix domain-containing protein [Halomonas sp. BC04]
MARLISYIFRQRPINHKGRQWAFVLTFSKRWLADQLAMSPETLSRKLLVLRECGAIQVFSHTIEIISEKKLHELLLQEE